MSLWERFSRIIYKSIATPFLKRYRNKSIESILKKSIAIIDSDTISELKHRLTNSLTKDGAFPDRGGKSDIYYTMFGCFVAEALSMNEIFSDLKDYVKRTVTNESLSGIDLYCGAILYSKLHGFDNISERLKEKVKYEIEAEVKVKAKVENKIKSGISTGYTFFIGLLTLYYLQDYRSILKMKKRINSISSQNDIPSSLAAAEATVNRILGKSGNDDHVKLRSFYRGNGGFVALQKAPVTDLLSTAVALYALQFIDSDIKDIKPDCLTFVDGLYLNGGFRATELDFDIDIEYTFYGLLALGALTN
jgi:hypothetical protein